jgi:tetratricopeptide (TPR) repeat protein
MKKILVTVVLGVAVIAGAQGAAQPAPAQSAAQPAQSQPAASPAQAQPAAPQSTAPVIKDPAEYNAYVAATGTKDPAAEISGLEAFLTQYPNSIMKNQALEILMSTYQQSGNSAKTLETAKKLVASDPSNVRALTLLAYFDRTMAQNGDPNAKQLLVDAKTYGQQGLDNLPKFTKPDGTSPEDFKKMTDQMSVVFHAAIGIACLQDKDYPCAITHLRAAVDGSPQDFSIVYPLGVYAYLGQPTPDYQNGIWFAARAAAIAPPQAEPQIEKYARAQYVKFHQGDDGWPAILAAAKANGPQVPIPLPPTPADQAHAMLVATHPDKMDFAQWEFILSNGSQEDQDAVWNGVKDKDGKVVVEGIKGKAVQLNGTVIKATATEFDIAGSLDDIDAKKADITLTFEAPIPKALIPKEGASIDFQGEPSAYTPNPFMMTMEKGLLAKPKTAPKAPVHPHSKPAAQ